MRSRSPTAAPSSAAPVSTPADRGLELGYWIGEPYWKRGYATEAAHALVDLAFRATRLNVLHVSCRVINPASRRVIHKCGFQYAGQGMLNSIVAGQVPVERYRLDRKTWVSLRTWARSLTRGLTIRSTVRPHQLSSSQTGRWSEPSASPSIQALHDRLARLGMDEGVVDEAVLFRLRRRRSRRRRRSGSRSPSAKASTGWCATIWRPSA